MDHCQWRRSQSNQRWRASAPTATTGKCDRLTKLRQCLRTIRMLISRHNGIGRLSHNSTFPTSQVRGCPAQHRCPQERRSRGTRRTCSATEDSPSDRQFDICREPSPEGVCAPSPVTPDGCALPSSSAIIPFMPPVQAVVESRDFAASGSLTRFPASLRGGGPKIGIRRIMGDGRFDRARETTESEPLDGRRARLRLQSSQPLGRLS